jgi:hypothetical protein
MKRKQEQTGQRAEEQEALIHDGAQGDRRGGSPLGLSRCLSEQASLRFPAGFWGGEGQAADIFAGSALLRVDLRCFETESNCRRSDHLPSHHLGDSLASHFPGPLEKPLPLAVIVELARRVRLQTLSLLDRFTPRLNLDLQGRLDITLAAMDKLHLVGQVNSERPVNIHRWQLKRVLASRRIHTFRGEGLDPQNQARSRIPAAPLNLELILPEGSIHPGLERDQRNGVIPGRLVKSDV